MIKEAAVNHQSSSPEWTTKQIINVSSVPQRSPFRYPGGKTWLVPRIKQWLASLPFRPTEFIEPFAGGAIVGLTVAFEDLADHVKLVEIDERIGAVWQAIIEKGHGEWLAEKIESFDLRTENVEALLAIEDLPLRELAFQTIVHNRVSRGGIVVKGAGLIKYGENGKGLASRWYPKTLSKRIRNIHKIRNRLSFVWGDGLKVIEQNIGRPEVVFFVDPPYTAGSGKRAGLRLYAHSELDHKRLFKLMEGVRGDFLISYDNDKFVQEMADQHGFEKRPVAMKSTHHNEMTELLIGRDLSWVA
jgi:DNA adenine methylase